LGCSTDETSVPAEPAGVEVIYAAASETDLTPYPSDRYAVADAMSATGLRVAVGKSGTRGLLGQAAAAPVVEEIDARDGFSTLGGVVVMFAGPIDVAGVASTAGEDPATATAPRDPAAFTEAGSPLLLVDVDPASPERGSFRGLVARYWEQPAGGDFAEDDFTLIVQPAEPLAPRRRYLFAVTDALRGRDGGPVVASPRMRALLDPAAPAPAGEEAYAPAVREAVALLAAETGVGAERLALATVFTTGTVHDELVATAAAARQGAPPKLLEPWTVETPAAPDGRVRFRAVLAAPEYRQAGDQRWKIESGAGLVQATVGLEIFVAFADATGKTPHLPVIYGHGLGGDKDGSWGTAERLAELGAAVFAIDAPHHGSRAPAGASELGAITGFFGVDLGEASFVIGRARDNFRQMALDQLELVRLLGTLGALDLLPVGAPDGKPDLDVAQIFYIGHSFGSVLAPTAMALAPEIGPAVWNVGGAGLMTLMRDSDVFAIMVEAMRPPGVSDGEVARFFAVAQGIIDPGDPLSFAAGVTRAALPGVAGWKPRDVLLQEVIADGIVPNSTSRAVARAAGLALVEPFVERVGGLAPAKAPLSANLASGATGALSQFDRFADGSVASHGELMFDAVGRAQYVEFFRTARDRGRATVTAPY
jgi:hypothetical protein